VARPVILADVGLDLDDPPGTGGLGAAVADQAPAEDRIGDLEGRALEELSGGPDGSGVDDRRSAVRRRGAGGATSG
jgi:hypothetical protein